MNQTKKITLFLDPEKKRDKNIYTAVKNFGKKHNITNDSEALKSFMLYLHFLSADNLALNDKIKDLS